MTLRGDRRHEREAVDQNGKEEEAVAFEIAGVRSEGSEVPGPEKSEMWAKRGPIFGELVPQTTKHGCSEGDF